MDKRHRFLTPRAQRPRGFKKLTQVLLFTGLSITASTNTSAAQAVDLPQTIYIAAGQTGSLQNTIASGVAKVLSDALGVKVVVRPFAGTTAFFPDVNQGNIAFAIAPSVDFGLSYQGKDNLQIAGKNPYPTTPDLRLVSSGSLLIAGLLVQEDSDIKQMKDLKGHKIAGKYPAHLGAFINTYAHLLNAGLTAKDVREIPVAGLNQGLDALTDGRVDAAVYGVGAPGVKQANAKADIRFVSNDCSSDAMTRVQNAVPGYEFLNVPKDKFTGIVEDACITAYPLYLTASIHTPDHVVKAVTTALYENADKLGKYHPTLKSWTSEKMVNVNMTLPYHGAAIEAYEAKNAWTDEAKNVNDKLMNVH